MTPFHRRHLLTRGAALFGAAALPTSIVFGARPSRDAHGTLVVLQLSGGNDGLSMLVPYADPVYRKARRVTRLASEDVLKIDERVGLHPNLKRTKALYDAGHCAVVEAVGYPDGQRSHFKSLEVWHTGRAAGRKSGSGWLGRLAEDGLGAPEATPEMIVHLGGKTPYSIHTASASTVALASPTAYRWFGESPGEESICEHMPDVEADPATSGRDAALAKMRGILTDAQESSLAIRAASARYRPRATYPRTAFGAQLQDVAALIHGDLGTRVLSTGLGGFDTHSNQKGRHDNLMNQLDGALGAFLEDLGHTEAGRRTTVMVFSEFGRRVQENGSRGTDHGKGGPMLVLGHGVKGGLHGKPTNLRELDQGDVVFSTDFRSVYASVLEGAVGVKAKPVLGKSYPKLDLLR